MGLLRFLFIAILILSVVRLVMRWLLPMLFQSLVNKAAQQQQNANNYQQSKKPEGVIKVDYIPEGKKQQVPDSEGDFVDYEEIK